jgi:hypothetical protein
MARPILAASTGWECDRQTLDAAAAMACPAVALLGVALLGVAPLAVAFRAAALAGGAPDVSISAAGSATATAPVHPRQDLTGILPRWDDDDMPSDAIMDAHVPTVQATRPNNSETSALWFARWFGSVQAARGCSPCSESGTRMLR